ncbi:hypothetical protein [Streptomyces anulatus]|uniref:hypothetical protein n=1 Tax=Streptomyces anulatus TaxID=1892 RepID=UPI00332615B9
MAQLSSTRSGCTVLAVEGPGHGASAGLLPEGQPPAERTTTLHAAPADFARDVVVNNGVT